MPKIRILIVDDAVLVRKKVSQVLSADPLLEVVGVAANGRIALAKLPLLKPDLVILDMEMPEMSGLETLAEIRKISPNLPTIIFSLSTQQGADATLEALALGAKDYIAKPRGMESAEAIERYLQEQLIPKIKVFCADRIEAKPPILEPELRIKSQDTKCLNNNLKDGFPGKNLGTSQKIQKPKSIEILAIGVSTGGPNALATIIPRLPANFPIPIAIVQHMPPMFTKSLAERLTAISQIPVTEGYNGAELRPGTAWIAPGDFHINVERKGTTVRLRTHQGPPENSCRPSVDVLFRSVAETYGASTCAVVLTGMGKDGLRGCEYIREAGGKILVQDQASSVVWGMPGFVAKAGLADKVLPLEEMATEIWRSVCC